ncbi:MAG: hypothetical protein H0V34_13550 [Gammaproteobacteria bacterium]|nr:hypothetical protein [Gammaproteobacteria bacterium]
MPLARATLLFAVLLGAVAAQSTPAHHYTVSIDRKLQTLSVRVCFSGAPPRALVAASEHARFFVKMPGGEEDPKRLALDDVPDDGCIAYQVDVAGIAILGQLTLGSWIGNDMIVAPDVWLWRPANPDANIELRFDLPPGIAVSAPWRPLPGGGYDVGHTPAHWPAAVALGRFEEREIKVPGAVLRLAVLDADPLADVEEIQTWIEDAARAVAGLYGRFPVDHAQVLVIPKGEGDGPVPYGHVMRGGAGAVRLFIDQRRPLKEFLADWTATHEFAHLTLPLERRGGAWLSEGIASYYQEILRARSGGLTPQQAWQELHEGFERGKQASADATLLEASANMYRDSAYTRVYWSGAAIALLADLELRKLSDNKQSLDSALEKLGRCCQPWDRAWSARELLARLDELTGTTVFTELYREHVFSKDFPELTDAYAELGLKLREGEFQLPPAPNAHMRDAIMHGT